MSRHDPDSAGLHCWMGTNAPGEPCNCWSCEETRELEELERELETLPASPGKSPGEQLRQWRRRNNVTVPQLAELLDYSEVMVFKLQSGEAKPSLHKAFEIESITGIPARNWIF